jgi:predicted nucleotidyltransferase
VRAAKRLPGITRIALIGSLTTNKANPKDADLLLSVTDDTDLTSLARLTRKLQGHAQTIKEELPLQRSGSIPPQLIKHLLCQSNKLFAKAEIVTG